MSTPESYLPPSFRPSPMEKVIVLVTTDAENLHVVDITGAMTAAFIRERIFTKVSIKPLCRIIPVVTSCCPSEAANLG